MRPATVLGDLPICSRRASTGLLRCHQCQPGRPGRLARVVPATAPPSSPTSSNSISLQSANPLDPAAQPRTSSGQVALQQATTLAQKPSAAAPTTTQPTASSSAGSAAVLGHLSAAFISPTSITAITSSPDSDPNGNPIAPVSTPAPLAPTEGWTAVPMTPKDSLSTSSPIQAQSQPLPDARDALAAAINPIPILIDVAAPSPSQQPTDASSPATSHISNGRTVSSTVSNPPSPPSTTCTSKVPNGIPSATKPAPPRQPSTSGINININATTATAASVGLGTSPASEDTWSAAAQSPPLPPISPSTSRQSTAPLSPVTSSAPPGAAASQASVATSHISAAPTVTPTSASTTTIPGSGALAGNGPSAPASQQSAAAATMTSPQPQPLSTAVPTTASGTARAPGAAAAAPPAPMTPSPLNSPSSNSPAAAGPASGGATSAVPQAAVASAGASSGAGPSPAAMATLPQAPPTPSPLSSSSSSATTAPISSASSGFQLRPLHVVIFAAIFLGGALFAALTLQFTADLDFQAAASTVARRVARSVAFRQLCVIACAICLVRFGLNNVLRALAQFSSNPIQWDKSKVFYILKEVYQPLELLLFIAAICTIADSFVPQLIAVPRSTVSTVVRSTLSVSFIIGAATVVFNLKSRFCKENAWQSEMNGDVTAQRRWEAYDKLGTFVIYSITLVLGIQALGLEVTSVLAIGGIGGLAIGLAGREICENILNGFLIMSTSPFEVGDEVHFFHHHKVVEGIVLDIGWYRTTIRSYEREVFVVPNAVFSKNIVLNITRKNREWRFFELVCVRVQDVHKVNAIIQDIRRIVRNDQRIITKLHRRIFLDKLTHDDCRIYVSFYVEAQNRESFMAAKQDLLLAFVDCVERNGAKLAVPRTTVQVEPEVLEALSPMLGAAVAMAAAKVTMDVQQAAGNAAAAAARALTDGRTITAEVTAVTAAGTTATSGKATGTYASSGSQGKSGGGGAVAGLSGGGGGGGGGGGVGSNAATEAAGATGGADGGAATLPSAPEPSQGNGLTWLLSKLAHMLFET